MHTLCKPILLPAGTDAPGTLAAAAPAARWQRVPFAINLVVGLTVMPTPSTQASRAGSVSMAISKPSNAMPFLTAPASQSSGLLGAEAGFDPLYLSDFLDIKFLREAELKHGRICML